VTTKLKKLLLIFLLVELTLSYSTAFAQTLSGFDYQKAGVSDQIAKYLCAPNTVPEKETEIFNNVGQAGKDYQTTAAFNNNNSGVLYQCINQIYKFAIVIAAVVGVFFIVIAGYIYMSSDGDAEAVSKAKSILTSSIASIVILYIGYVLLKALNPDLIEFQSVQPPSVKTSNLVQLTEPPSGEPAAGQIPSIGLNTSSIPNNAKGSVEQLLAAGCTITAEARPRNEVPNISSPMWSKLLQICQIASASGHKPNVTSTVRRESVGSYHQKACAIDFADGKGDGFFNINTKTGRPAGVAIYNAAKQAGISESRINPGVDAKQTFHIHIDLGNSCPNN
jgi:hypothetical protein